MCWASGSESDTLYINTVIPLSKHMPAPVNHRVLENPLYYLENFHLVLAWIGERYDDLLTDEERDFLRAFPALPQASRALFVRMVMRKGTVFRASKLVYAEIGSAQEAARPLVALGLVEDDPQLD